jgi:diamine N-acetyltransferase
MADVTLLEITRDTWRTCVGLQVDAEQRRFVAHNAFSLAQAAYETNWRPRGIYAEDRMVGFVMYGLEPENGKLSWMILRLMTDKKHQGKGYARAAMCRLLDLMRAERPDITDVYISFVPDNAAARHLYTSLGFREVGMTDDGEEVLMHLSLFSDA